MKNIRFYILFSLFIGLSWAHAQQQIIRFETDTHDFGDVKAGTKPRFAFKFTNLSDKPVALRNVKGGCVCTRPMWSEAPVNPGEQGEILVEFDSKKGKIGDFHKSVVVQTSASDQVDMVFIKGRVVPAKPTQAFLNPKYKYAQGYINFRDPAVNFALVKSDETKSFWVYFENTSPKPVQVVGAPNNSPFILVDVSKPIKVKSEGLDSIQFTIDGSKFDRKIDGFIQDTLRLITDDVDNGVKNIPLVGSWKRVYTPEELAKAPKIQFESVTFDAGKIIQGEKMNHSFKFTNTGGSELIITGAKPSCGCTASAPENTEIPPGQSSQINISFDSTGRTGNQTKNVTVSSNDPLTPSLVLTFTCEIVVDPFKSSGGLGGK
jgi:hypothetical protein